MRRVSQYAEALPALAAQVVVVLSAMKMMNEIAALATGTVQSVAVAKDQQACARSAAREYTRANIVPSRDAPART